jgi:hypothetical protein
MAEPEVLYAQARDMRKRPVFVMGIAEGHPDSPSTITQRPGLASGMATCEGEYRLPAASDAQRSLHCQPQNSIYICHRGG